MNSIQGLNTSVKHPVHPTDHVNWFLCQGYHHVFMIHQMPESHKHQGICNATYLHIQNISSSPHKMFDILWCIVWLKVWREEEWSAHLFSAWTSCWTKSSSCRSHGLIVLWMTEMMSVSHAQWGAFWLQERKQQSVLSSRPTRRTAEKPSNRRSWARTVWHTLGPWPHEVVTLRLPARAGLGLKNTEKVYWLIDQATQPRSALKEDQTATRYVCAGED